MLGCSSRATPPPQAAESTTPAAESAEVAPDDLISLCANELGSYKKPSHVELRTEPLPKSPVGKLQRKVLREPFWADTDRRVAGN